MYSPNQVCAEYIDGLGIVYYQYHKENASRSERAEIEQRNAENYSVSTQNHEELHHRFANVHNKIHDGSLILKISDRVRAKIMEEICCLKVEDGLPSIADAIQSFKNQKRDVYYSRHYGERPGERVNSALVAMIAEDKVPEKVFQEFDRTNKYKVFEVNGQEYIANCYTSCDKKYQTWCVHNQDDQIVRTPEIISQSPVAVGILGTADGKEVKTADGKTVTTSYALSPGSQFQGNYPFRVDNFEKIKQGYNFERAEENFAQTCREYAEAAGLTPQEAKMLKDFVSDMEFLNAYDLQDKEIAELRDNYKNTPLSELTAKAKENYEHIHAKNIIRAKEELNLKEVLPPSAYISQNDLKSINTSAFYRSAKGKGGI